MLLRIDFKERHFGGLLVAEAAHSAILISLTRSSMGSRPAHNNSFRIRYIIYIL